MPASRVRAGCSWMRHARSRPAPSRPACGRPASPSGSKVRFPRPKRGRRCCRDRSRRCSMHKTLTLAAAALAAVALLGADQAPVALNVTLPLTGQAALSGASEQHGLQGVEVLVNATGGINGRPLKMIFNDDGSNAQNALALTNQIAAKGAQVILGAALAAEC